MRNLIVISFIAASLICGGAAFSQKPAAKPSGGKFVTPEHYECTKCRAEQGPTEAKDAGYLCKSCQSRMAKVRGPATPAIECPKCHGKWDIMQSKTLKGKCPRCKTQLAPYMPPTHMECPNCGAQWTEMESLNLKKKCPACNVNMQKVSGPVDATYFCKRCNMKWSQRDADKLKMKCPKCKGALKTVVPK